MNNTPVMLQHDPNDDPFAELSVEVDAKSLVSPLEFGSGAVDPSANDSSHANDEVKEVKEVTQIEKKAEEVDKED